MAKAAPAQSNVSSDLWAEALAVYEEDTGVVDRANGQRRRHQQAYENQGIPAAEVRRRYKEKDMTADERAELYAVEQISRRALDLWSADSPEDFERLIERAASTPAASAETLGKLDGARAYNDGFNGGAHGGLTQDDNKHVPGSIEFVQWSHGCADGVDYATTFGAVGAPKTADVAPRESAHEPEVPASVAAAKTKKTRKQAAPPADIPPESLFGDMTEMPEVPGLPN